MPRNDDNYGDTRLYVGHLPSRTSVNDLEKLFGKYGRVRVVKMKRDFAFVEFSDHGAADYARYCLDGHDYAGSRLIVEFRKAGCGYLGRGRPPPEKGGCFNCGCSGHVVRECQAWNQKMVCFKCGERGHRKRNCKNSSKESRHGQSYSRSPVGSRYPLRGRSRYRSYRQDHGYSRSRSRSPIGREERRFREGSQSPLDRSPLPYEGSRHRDNGRRKRGQSYSRSPVRSRYPHRGRCQDRSYRRDHSYSRSRCRSPIRREERWLREGSQSSLNRSPLPYKGNRRDDNGRRKLHLRDDYRRLPRGSESP